MINVPFTWSKLNTIKAGLRGIGADDAAVFCRYYKSKAGGNGNLSKSKPKKKILAEEAPYLKINRDAFEKDKLWKPTVAAVPTRRKKPPVPLTMDSHQAQNLTKMLQSLDETNTSSHEEKQPQSDGDISSDAFTRTILRMEDTDFKKAYIDNIYANLTSNDNLEAKPEELEHCSVKGPDHLDQTLLEKLIKKQHSTNYLNMLEGRQRLPAYGMRNEIVELVNNNKVVVLSGETGCGKTTQVPQFLLDHEILAGRGSACRVVCTQPRRISAISVAQRVAEERGELLGQSVGYQIRLEGVRARDCGSIMYCTPGIVLQWLQSDPSLNTVSHLVLDEIHERDMQSDFLITIARDLLPRRPDLKLILMSATLNAEKFSEYYGGCAMTHIPGFTFPVKEYYLEDVLEMTRFQYPMQPKAAKRPPGRGKRGVGGKHEMEANTRPRSSFHDLVLPWLGVMDRSRAIIPVVVRELAKPCSEELCPALVVRLLRHICQQPPGAVLIFLPGWADITEVHQLIQDDPFIASQQTLVLPLHSRMSSFSQGAIFDQPPPGVRKIVLATNVAETSITIDDIVYVIDGGFSKMRTFDKQSNVDTLESEWVTRANAHQRRGRAGRVQAGVCYHLFTRKRLELLAGRPTPEVGRMRLDAALLQVKALGLGDGHRFMAGLMDPPDEDIVEMALQMLESIRALDEDENLTPLGFHLSKLPMDPLMGRMLLMAAIFSCVDPILTVAAVLSFKGPFVVPLGKESKVDEIKARFAGNTYSDHMMYVRAFSDWREAERRGDSGFCKAHHLSPSVLQQIRALREDFFKYLKERQFVSSDVANSSSFTINRHSANVALLRAVITSGLYPNVARVDNAALDRHRRLKLATADHWDVGLHPHSVNAHVLTRGGKNFQWMVFREQMKLSKVFLFDVSSIPNYPLLLFGERLAYNEQDNVIDVDGFVQVNCSSEVAEVMRKLRQELDALLQHKISHPGPTEWRPDSKEGKLLGAIVDLLSSEKMERGGVERVREKV